MPEEQEAWREEGAPRSGRKPAFPLTTCPHGLCVAGAPAAGAPGSRPALGRAGWSVLGLGQVLSPFLGLYLARLFLGPFLEAESLGRARATWATPLTVPTALSGGGRRF